MAFNAKTQSHKDAKRAAPTTAHSAYDFYAAGKNLCAKAVFFYFRFFFNASEQSLRCRALFAKRFASLRLSVEMKICEGVA